MIIIELIIEVMDHAVSHSDDTGLIAGFEADMAEFDVAEFVDTYREERELSADDFDDG